MSMLQIAAAFAFTFTVAFDVSVILDCICNSCIIGIGRENRVGIYCAIGIQVIEMLGVCFWLLFAVEANGQNMCAWNPRFLPAVTGAGLCRNVDDIILASLR